jgi:hypothetical protein
MLGAVMKDHVQSSKGNNPYCPLSCFLLLLTAMILFFIKIGVADQLFHLTPQFVTETHMAGGFGI